jgi:hypothetical protein
MKLCGSRFCFVSSGFPSGMVGDSVLLESDSPSCSLMNPCFDGLVYLTSNTLKITSTIHMIREPITPAHSVTFQKNRILRFYLPVTHRYKMNEEATFNSVIPQSVTVRYDFFSSTLIVLLKYH